MTFPSPSPRFSWESASSSLVFLGATARLEDRRFTLAKADTCCAPGYSALSLANRSAVQPAFVFIADETPLYKKLGAFEVRGSDRSLSRQPNSFTAEAPRAQR